jgi:hypothetical protein
MSSIGPETGAAPAEIGGDSVGASIPTSFLSDPGRRRAVVAGLACALAFPTLAALLPDPSPPPFEPKAPPTSLGWWLSSRAENDYARLADLGDRPPELAVDRRSGAVYALCGDGDVARSDDDGRSWRVVARNVFGFADGERPSRRLMGITVGGVDSKRGAILAWADFGPSNALVRRVFVSNDGGATWDGRVGSRPAARGDVVADAIGKFRTAGVEGDAIESDDGLDWRPSNDLPVRALEALEPLTKKAATNAAQRPPESFGYGEIESFHAAGEASVLKLGRRNDGLDYALLHGNPPKLAATTVDEDYGIDVGLIDVGPNGDTSWWRRRAFSDVTEIVDRVQTSTGTKTKIHSIPQRSSSMAHGAQPPTAARLGSRLFLLDHGGGLFVRDAASADFRAVSSDDAPESRPFASLHASPKGALLATHYGGGVARSDDEGGTWRATTRYDGAAAAEATGDVPFGSWFVDEAGVLRPPTALARGAKPAAVGKDPPRFSAPPIAYALPFLAAAATFALVGFAGRRKNVAKKSIADCAAADSPLKPGEFDATGAAVYANAVDFFVRNRRTLGPVSIAINGKWGGGKSSLMNLASAALRKAGTPVVWFNAWHYRGDDGFLRALYTVVRDRSLAPVYSTCGVAFRARLFWSRFKRAWRDRPLTTFAFSAVFGASASAVLAQSPAATLATLEKALTLDATLGEALQALLPLLGLVGSGAWPTLKSLRAFGVDTAALAKRLKDGAPASQDADFRAAFAREFREVVASLGPNRKLVVVVDDLDRCTPAEVAAMLEAVNFLMTSAPCVVLAGFDDAYVRGCVRLAYSDVSKETDAERDDPRPFEERYLEKIFNLRVDVPKPDRDQAAAILARTANATSNAENLGAAPSFARRFALAASLIVATLVALGTGARLSAEWAARTIDGPTSASEDASASGALRPESRTTSRETETSSPERSALEVAKDGSDGPARPPADGATPEPPTNPAGVVALGALAAIAIFIARGRPAVPIEDSQAFVDRLTIAGRELHRHGLTPRDYKRFLNRTRFSAMVGRAAGTSPADEAAVVDDALRAELRRRDDDREPPVKDPVA